MPENNQGVAEVDKIRRWSPVWIIPIVTVLIGAWILFYHFSTQGPMVTLITTNAEGIVGGKTAIKSRSVDIGIVESVDLSRDLNTVIIKARLNNDMSQVLNKDSVFWVVKPQIGRDGVSGLGTLLSGVYIEIQPGRSAHEERSFTLFDSAPLASPDSKGLRIALESSRSGQLSAGDPVLYRGYRVGTVENGEFDPQERVMRYTLYIMAPYQQLVTTNVRFWQESGLAFDMSAQGVRVEMASIQTLLSGGVSFDTPAGWPEGELANENDEYELYSNQSSIQDSLFTRYENFLLLFNDSIRGLSSGAPVEFRGIRIGTVVEAPFYLKGPWEMSNRDLQIPVLIRIEPDRIKNHIGTNEDFRKQLLLAQKNGLRAALKSANLLTGSLYVDLDYYAQVGEWKPAAGKFDYPVIATVSSGLSQIQQKLTQTLDKVNNLPLDTLALEMTNTLRDSQQMLKKTTDAMTSLDKLISNQHTQALPQDLQSSLNELNRTLKGVQPGSPAYSKMVDDMKRLDQTLRELQPVIRTLNEKSNALVFEAQASSDPKPKGAKK